MADENIPQSGEVNPLSSPPSDPVEAAKLTVLRMEEQNKILQENIRKLQELQARAILSGNANAGSVAPKVPTVEEIAHAEAKAFAEKVGWKLYK